MNNTIAEYRKAERHMGNNFEITVVCDDANIAYQCIDGAYAEIERIEKLLSTFLPDSQTNRINDEAGIGPVEVDKEVYDLIERSIRISKLTDGAFDISYGSIDKRLWNFDRNMASLPDSKTALAMVQLINYKNIVLNPVNHTVFLKEKGMRIGFGGIGKGYAAEKAKQWLQSKGFKSGLVNASGDISTWGTQANGQPWTIGIAHPDHPATAFSYLNISDMAIATSGNYEKFVIINGRKYSHTINPKTGLPVTGIKSVSIICSNAEIADAMATPVTIMGIKAGLAMINQIHGLGCIIIDDNNHIFSSTNINLQ